MFHDATAGQSPHAAARQYFGARRAMRRHLNLLDCEKTGVGIWVPSDLDDLIEIFERFCGHSMIDLGAGDGLVLAAAAPFFTAVHGVELSPGWAAMANAARRDLGLRNVSVVEGDYLDFSLRGYSMVFIAPDAPFSQRLNDKLCHELTGLLAVYCPIYRPTGLTFAGVAGGKVKPCFLFRNAVNRGGLPMV